MLKFHLSISLWVPAPSDKPHSVTNCVGKGHVPIVSRSFRWKELGLEKVQVIDQCLCNCVFTESGSDVFIVLPFVCRKNRFVAGSLSHVALHFMVVFRNPKKILGKFWAADLQLFSSTQDFHPDAISRAKAAD